jgi:hypothetical protein
MSSDADKKEQKRLQSKEYEQREYRKEKRRLASATHAKEQKLINTMKRLEKHTDAELMHIMMVKCEELGIDYESNEIALKIASLVLSGSRNVQKSDINIDISDKKPTSTSA